ncbi:NTP transferase domain-containing protein [Natranaeroarchaeum aerophilus]|uniref:NTP transferase domain-containing protein n=2 Tax=Natranaeroarchaeum aerophilus TaxID=2917711 RepID=A0AAE3FSN3_9EURY|nr:NTP transferase domain-containing protein [Natranaeroarchaeum aerophilus]MCL9814486.1 NTP transferase domain-containing protein [Natranaeroarchaeum aerophilus]
MCGGEGTRLADSLGRDAPEKPMYPIDGRPMVDRVLDALEASEVDQVHAAVSPATPETRGHIAERVSVIETPGKGYVTDLSTALDNIDRPVLTVAADLPLLTGCVVDSMLSAYAAIGIDGGSMTVAVPATRKDRLGVSADTVMERDAMTAELIDGRADSEEMPDRIAPTGLNVVGAPTDTNTDTMYLTDDERLVVNVNRARDARIAEALL